MKSQQYEGQSQGVAVLSMGGDLDLSRTRHPTALGEGGLRSLVGACAGLTAQECVDRVGEAIADPGGQAPDDVCILVLRVAP